MSLVGNHFASYLLTLQDAMNAFSFISNSALPPFIQINLNLGYSNLQSLITYIKQKINHLIVAY
jgi:hypothetical protein